MVAPQAERWTLPGAHGRAQVRRRFLECGGPEARVAVERIGEGSQVAREDQMLTRVAGEPPWGVRHPTCDLPVA